MVKLKAIARKDLKDAGWVQHLTDYQRLEEAWNQSEQELREPSEAAGALKSETNLRPILSYGDERCVPLEIPATTLPSTSESRFGLRYV